MSVRGDREIVYHECEGDHKTSRLMTNSDPEGQIFLSVAHTNDGLFLLLTI